jgi:hypothetical protein
MYSVFYLLYACALYLPYLYISLSYLSIDCVCVCVYIFFLSQQFFHTHHHSPAIVVRAFPLFRFLAVGCVRGCVCGCVYDFSMPFSMHPVDHGRL